MYDKLNAEMYILSQWQAVDPFGEVLQLGIVPVFLFLLFLKLSHQQGPEHVKEKHTTNKQS